MRFLLLAGMLLACATAFPGETRVSAYYYPWYGTDGNHWDLGYLGKHDGKGPALGEYDSRSPEVIRQHLATSREFGIDNWVCSWWGPGSREDETLRRHVLPELETAGKAANPVTFCLFYEAAGLLGLDLQKGIVFDTAKTNLFASHFRFMADEYFSHPAYLRVDGKPVVYLYLSRAFNGDASRALGTARAVASARGFDLYLVGDEVYWGDPDPERLKRFEAVTSYNMHGPVQYAGLEDWTPFLKDCETVYQCWQRAAAAVGVKFIPGVMPGFDSRGTDPTAHYPIPRQLSPGAGPVSFFEAMGEMAKRHLDSVSPEVAVTSFNEWHEGTQVEPGKGESEKAGEVLGKVFGRKP